MGKITFEGTEPFDQIIVHTASADAAGETVELTLYVPAPPPLGRRVPIHISNAS
jgi:hypothetical protein